MRIAWFTPYYPSSAIGTYSAVVVDALQARGHNVTVFAPNEAAHGSIRATGHRVVPITLECSDELLAQLAAMDIVVYNLGNHFPYHGEIYEYARRCPGIVVLHDVVMRGFFWGYSVYKLNSHEPLLKLLQEAHGDEARQHAARIMSGESPNSVDDPGTLRWPLFAPALKGCLGVVVHSEYARNRIQETLPLAVAKIDFPRFGPAAAHADREPPSKADDHQVRFLTLGELNPNKRIELTIRAIANSTALRQQVAFHIIGGGTAAYKQELQCLIDDCGLRGQVHLLGRQSDDVLFEHLQRADVVVNLRNPHMGESSASLMDALLAGAPSVVWNHGFYAEFPDHIVTKVSRDAELQPALEALVANVAARRQQAAAARNYALDLFNSQRYCERFESFAALRIAQKPAYALIDRVSRHLREWGANPNDPFVAKVARELASMACEATPSSAQHTPLSLTPRANREAA